MKDRISFLGLEAEACTIGEWAELIMAMWQGADSLVMVNAARDFSYSLAQVYIGMLVSVANRQKINFFICKCAWSIVMLF